MNGSSVITALMKKFSVTTDQGLAVELGLKTREILGWKRRAKVNERQIAGLVRSAMLAGEKQMQTHAIRPLVEFFPIKHCPSRQGAKCELFSIHTENGEPHPYREGLQDELKRKHGVYIFFDSRGHAIYTGKARRLSLWAEMNNAFNRERGEVQKIKRVTHPTRKQEYRTTDEITRQISDQFVPLHELATYFSAYEIVDGMINEVEAMLIRSSANDLLNTRMEKFGVAKRKKKTA